MKFRIIEFQKPDEKTNNRFFVQVGKTHREKLFWFITVPKTTWEFIPNEEEDDKPAIGHRTFEEALKLVDELKKQIPIYHYIA